MKRVFTLSLIFGLLACGLASGDVLNVPGDYAQIHDAVQACADGDTVLVAAGTFNDCVHPTEGPESTPASVIMKSGVTLRGAGPEATIIDVEQLGRGIFIENVSNCRVENLQVTNAYAQIYGAGILIREVDASVEVNDVRVTTCTDGGVICINNSHPTLRRVTMDHNEAKQGGGLAIEEFSNPTVIDCVIDANQSPSGAGLFMRHNCSPNISGCIISNNTITANWGNGGGISIQGSDPTITHCRIFGNTTYGYGGGVAFLDGSSGLMEDCYIQDNDAAYVYSQGGGIATSTSNPTLRRLVITGNTASGFNAEGGGLDISFAPAPVLENCTIANNATSGNGFGGGLSIQWSAEPTLDNCIIAGSTVGQGIYCSNATPVISCSDVFGNAGGDELCGTDGGGNFSADPLFCGTVGHEFGLTAESPCGPGNHPDGSCDRALIGAVAVGCGDTPVPSFSNRKLALSNHPNPFNPSTTITFDLPRPGAATLRIYDLAGRLLTEHTWSQLPQGRTEFQWTGRDNRGRSLPSGIYMYRLDTGSQTLSRRMSLIK